MRILFRKKIEVKTLMKLTPSSRQSLRFHAERGGNQATTRAVRCVLIRNGGYGPMWNYLSIHNNILAHGASLGICTVLVWLESYHASSCEPRRGTLPKLAIAELHPSADRSIGGRSLRLQSVARQRRGRAEGIGKSGLRTDQR